MHVQRATEGSRATAASAASEGSGACKPARPAYAAGRKAIIVFNSISGTYSAQVFNSASLALRVVSGVSGERARSKRRGQNDKKFTILKISHIFGVFFDQNFTPKNDTILGF